MHKFDQIEKDLYSREKCPAGQRRKEVQRAAQIQ